MKFLKILISLMLIASMCGCEVVVEEMPPEESESGQNFNYYPDENLLYETLLEELSKGKYTIDFDGVVDMDMLSKVADRIEHEYPEYYMVSGGSSIVSDSKSSSVSFSFLENPDEDKIKSELYEVNAVAKEIIASMPEGLDDYGKVLFVHDYIAENVVYATDKVGIESNGLWDTAYGCLVQGSAVCGGYSKGFSYMMKLLGIESGVVSGEATDENGKQTGHAWNYVKLNGMYYWLDVTWDDIDEENNPVTHFYFLIDDARMNKNRILHKNQYFVPSCYSMDENFYVRNNSYIAYYSAEAVGEAIRSSPYDDKVELMFSDDVSYDTALFDLFDNGKLWELSDFADMSDTVTYTMNEDLNAICINY